MDFRLHLLKAEKNEKFLSSFLMTVVEECPDWVSVVAFYTALHFVEAFLNKNHGLHFEYHEDRHSYMSNHLAEIFNAYHHLYDLGYAARYESIKDSPTCDEATSAVKFELAEIREYVMSRI
jgi:hypothetical protein